MYAKKPSVFQAASFVYAAFIVWSNKRILVYLCVFCNLIAILSLVGDLAS